MILDVSENSIYESSYTLLAVWLYGKYWIIPMAFLMMHRHVQDFDGDGSKLLVGGPFIDYLPGGFT